MAVCRSPLSPVRLRLLAIRVRFVGAAWPLRPDAQSHPKPLKLGPSVPKRYAKNQAGQSHLNYLPYFLPVRREKRAFFRKEIVIAACSGSRIKDRRARCRAHCPTVGAVPNETCTRTKLESLLESAACPSFSSRPRRLAAVPRSDSALGQFGSGAMRGASKRMGKAICRYFVTQEQPRRALLEPPAGVQDARRRR